MSKKAAPKIVQAVLRLRIPAGKATPSPPVGPVLGQQGLNLMEFCKEFNARSKGIKDGTIVPVALTCYSDKSFSFDLKSPPVSFFLKQCAGVTSGANTPGKQTVGEVSLKDVYEIARVKQTDPAMQALPLRSICKSIIASAKSMGITVVRSFQTSSTLR